MVVLLIFQFTFFNLYSFIPERKMDEQDRIFIPHNANVSQDNLKIMDESHYADLLYSRIGPYMTMKGTDGEAIDAAEHFFWGIQNGVVLELGAYDGRMHSQSLFYEEVLGWQRILVEGNPQLGRKIHQLNPRAISFNVAICNVSGSVHWAGGNNGILEFLPMSLLTGVKNGALYKAALHNNEVFSSGVIDWAKFDFSDFPDIVEIHCLPLSHIFSVANITHINFFVLDVEGGELSILQTIDWNRIRFDVIVVETEVGAEGDSITSLLLSKGYEKQILIGRNTWYRHEAFAPRSRKMRPKDLYMGYLLSQQNWRVFPKRFVEGNDLNGEAAILNRSCNNHIVCNKPISQRLGSNSLSNRERSGIKWH